MGFRKLLFTFSLLLSTFLTYAQVTTSGLNGKVTGTDNVGLPGATVVAIHLPSGTKYGTTTDPEGFYRLPNMNVGGPYKVSISYIGFNEFTQENVTLALGQALRLNAKLSDKSREIKQVEVVGQRNSAFNANRKGAQTVVSRSQIESLPTVGRNYTDFARLTPQARLTKDGSGNNGISIAGTNSRYNAIFVDGAVQNDVFGLSDNGANGGQIGISPFSVDIIDQININVSPFDVKQGGFAGGSINAVTRSGTNNVEGSAYYFFRNQDLAGKTPTNLKDVTRTKLANFTSQTYGLRVGGPIIKNKLFYFFNAEFQNDETPQNFKFDTYSRNTDGTPKATAASEALLGQLSDKLMKMGYDPGGYLDNVRKVNGTKLFLRLDWNINSVHKFTIRHQYTRGVSTSPANSSATTIQFANRGVYFPSTTNATTAELKSLFGNKASNSLLVGVNIVRDDRSVMGNPFPNVFFTKESVGFGSEAFSAANLLAQNVYTLTDNFELYKGKHTITIGTNNEFYNLNNVFIRNNFGAYTYANIQDFLDGKSPTRLQRTFSAVDNGVGDKTDAAAKLKAMQLSVYAQDDYQITDNFKLSYGIRADLPIFLDKPRENTGFNENVLPKLEAAGWDVKGARTGGKPDSKILLSPRIAFNWDVTGDQRTQIRGGAGIFTSRIPFVWVGGIYNNNGVTLGELDYRYDASKPTSPTNQPISFIPEYDRQPSITAVPSGQIDLFAKNFKFPQVFRTSLAIDRKLPWGLLGTLEGIYTKTLNNVNYYNLAYVKSGETLTGSGDDHRPLYKKLGTDVLGAYPNVYYAENTNKGFSYNLTAQLQKSFNYGLSASLAYTFSRAKGLNDGQSSQNSSQWRMPNVRGKNDLDLAYSIYDAGSRIVANVSYKKEYAGFMGTTVSLFYTGQAGDRFSYGYRDNAGNQNINKDLPGSGDAGLSIMYIPRSAAEINLVDYKAKDGSTVTKEDQWNRLNSFIENDKYLSSRRGEYVERNGVRTPFTHIFDLHVAQDFYIKQRNGSKHILQLTFDVFNLGNLLNKEWGRMYTARQGMSYNNYGLIDFVGFEANGTTPKFNYTGPAEKNKTVAQIDDIGLQTARWQSQVGIRYIFK
ncbi:TonB-dependent receptor [Chitinophaga nivalis]|uniref:Carboxypeptidase regulatory-like domain-containing protein n=1 Tax=Chitinophaga nivalis TaxID=2991709 RepID=A0ABT3IQL9_9BACT|nr:carboxypeptidase regulatory-like domain-containing protein [Chitinophaga nivalis]MCW3464052.1 carboxypeptidase regulatory-like domain-containing protein [Chitinophaga nivalis]MCW3486258.1 carboxypeptidase regulatory-like domain-containing protein [Chitinophaga nivalis]